MSTYTIAANTTSDAYLVKAGSEIIVKGIGTLTWSDTSGGTYRRLGIEDGRAFVNDSIYVKLAATTLCELTIDDLALNDGPDVIASEVAVDSDAAGLPVDVPDALGGGEWDSEVAIKYLNTRGPLDARDYGFATTATASANATALTNAFAAASDAQRDIWLPPGQYSVEGPISMPSNCHVYGAGSTSFGTQLIFTTTSGIYFDGSSVQKFHSSLNNVMIRHTGSTQVGYLLKVEKCYSIALRNIRFTFATQAMVSDAVMVFLDSCNDIRVERPIMQLTGVVQPIGIRFGNACGTIRVFQPDIEACDRNFKWEGGKIEIHAPYTESAGVNCIDSTPDSADTTAFLKVFGGDIRCAASGVGVAIRQYSHDVDFYGTNFTGSTANDIYVYNNGINRVNFWGPTVDYSKVNGVAGYLRYIGLHGRRLFGSKTQDWGSIASYQGAQTTVTVTGAKLGYHTARAWMDASTGGLMLGAQVTADDTVTVSAFNATGSAVDLASAGLYVVCDSAVRQ